MSGFGLPPMQATSLPRSTEIEPAEIPTVMFGLDIRVLGIDWSVPGLGLSTLVAHGVVSAAVSQGGFRKNRQVQFWRHEDG